MCELLLVGLLLFLKAVVLWGISCLADKMGLGFHNLSVMYPHPPTTHTRMHTDTHMYVHTHAYIHTHTHTTSILGVLGEVSVPTLAPSIVSQAPGISRFSALPVASYK